MLTINIEIKTKGFFGIETIKRVERSVWERWEDIPADLRPRVISLCINHPEDARLLVMKEMLNIDKHFLLLDILAPEEFGAILEKLNWLVIEPSTTPIILEFSHKGIKYVLPKANFENGTAYEYALLDRLYNQFLEHQKEEDLATLCAIICREVDEKNLPKSVTNSDELDLKAAHFADLPAEYAINVLSYVEGIRKFVFDLYGEYLFEEPLSEEELEDYANRGEEPPSGDPYGWIGLYMAMTDKPTELENILSMNFHTLCAYRIRQIKEARKQKNNARSPEL